MVAISCQRGIRRRRWTSPAASGGRFKSFSPRPIVLRAIPVTLDTAASPPRPIARTSAAANRRRPRSSNCFWTASFPGIYGDTFAGGYELVERLGVGGGVEFEVPDIAKLELKAAVFTRDSTALSGSLFTGRERLHVSDGGPGNTDLPESFSVALDAGEIEGLPGLALRTSVLRQAAGEGNDRSQWAFSIGGAWEIGVGDDWTITPVIDYVHSWDAIGIDAADGISGAAENYLTAGVAVGYESWNAALVGGRRWDSQPGAADVRDAFVQVSAGYTFENDISVDLGWL